MVQALEEVLGVTARLEFLPVQPGDVPQTWANMLIWIRLSGSWGSGPGRPFARGSSDLRSG